MRQREASSATPGPPLRTLYIGRGPGGGRAVLPESGWPASRSKYAVQSGRELSSLQVGGVDER